MTSCSLTSCTTNCSGGTSVPPIAPLVQSPYTCIVIIIIVSLYVLGLSIRVRLLRCLPERFKVLYYYYTCIITYMYMYVCYNHLYVY